MNVMEIVIMMIWVNWAGFILITTYRGAVATRYFLGAPLENRTGVLIGLWYGLLANMAREWLFSLVLASVVRAGWHTYISWWGMMV